MTTLAIVADIHGNAPALEAVVEVVGGEVDVWLCVGDLVGHLPMVNEVIERLQALDAHCVLGNHDAALLSGAAIPHSSAATRALQIQRRILSADNRAYLQNLPQRLALTFDGVPVQMVHGSLRDPLGEKVLSVDAALRQAAAGSVLLLGHTHRPLIDVGADYAVINPGAVGLPVDGEKRARVVLLTLPERRVRLLEVPYDPAPVLTQLGRLGYDERYANCLRAGRWVGFTSSGMQAPVIIAGAGIYGEIVADLITQREDMRVLGFVDDTPSLAGKSVAGWPVMGTIDTLGAVAAEAGVTDVAVAIGGNSGRRLVADRVKMQGVRLATLVHPQAYVAPSARLSPGVVVDTLSYVGPHCVLGEGVSVWPTVSISHHTVIEAYAALKPGVVIGGQSTVQAGLKVPLGSTWPSYCTITPQLVSESI